MHDLRYHIGGTLDAKHKADDMLTDCITAAEDSPMLGLGFFMGVMVGGDSYWGNGWNDNRTHGHKKFSELPLSEKHKAGKFVLDLHMDPNNPEELDELLCEGP